MAHPPKKILMCSCEDTMRLDPAAVERGCRNERDRDLPPYVRGRARPVPRHCRRRRGPLVVGCTQEAALLVGRSRRACGSASNSSIFARRPAGRSKARRPGRRWRRCWRPPPSTAPAHPFVTLSSEGVILIYGRDERAIEAGKLLADHLDVTVMITRPPSITPPAANTFPVVKGTIRNARGHFGAFELVIDDFAAPRPSSRDALVFDGSAQRRDLALRHRARSLRRAAAVSRARSARRLSARRSRDPAAMLRAVLKARDLIGQLRQAEIHQFHRRPVRAFALEAHRLPPLPRSVPDRRDRA